jgi:hypothetical protein
MKLRKSDGRMLHLAFDRRRITNLQKDDQDSRLAQTTLTFGEGGLPYTMGQRGATPHCASFQVAFIPQPTSPNQRELNSVVVCP